MANKETLFSEFQAPTTQEWLDKIEVDLKGADFQKRLVWRTNEGFNVQPFYRREDLKDLKTPDSLPGEFPFVRGNKKDSTRWASSFLARWSARRTLRHCSTVSIAIVSR